MLKDGKRMLCLPFPERRAEVLRFVRRHHYLRRSPTVWTIVYAMENARGRLQAVLMYGPPPYPTLAQAFVRDQAHIRHLIWQARMVGAGISKAELNALIAYAHADLTKRGYWWVFTLTDPQAHVIDNGLLRLVSPGYTGQVYARNGFVFLGTAGSGRHAWLIDGKVHHVRQGAVTLTRRNIREHFPEARQIQEIRGQARQRWAYVLGNAKQRAARLLLMRYHVQPWEPARQPRLFAQRGLAAQLQGCPAAG